MGECDEAARIKALPINNAVAGHGQRSYNQSRRRQWRGESAFEVALAGQTAAATASRRMLVLLRSRTLSSRYPLVRMATRSPSMLVNRRT